MQGWRSRTVTAAIRPEKREDDTENLGSNTHYGGTGGYVSPPFLSYSLSDSPALIFCSFQILPYKNSPTFFIKNT